MNRGLILWTVFGAAVMAQPRTYFQPKHHYAVEIPAGWNVVDANGNVPVFYTYRREDVMQHGMLPLKSAEIFIIPLGVDPRTRSRKNIREWSRENISVEYSNVITRELSGGSSTERLVVEGDYEWLPGEDLQHEVSYYVALGEELLRIRLIYWKDDPKGSQYELALEGVARTIRAQRNR